MEAVGDGFTWRRAASSLELDEDTLDDQMRDRIASGVRTLKEDAFVKAHALLFRRVDSSCLNYLC